jgi:hypothetical protein
VPFTEVDKISNLLEDLEINFKDKTRIDIELNNLEDAYINIAKEEEKFLIRAR